MDGFPASSRGQRRRHDRKNQPQTAVRNNTEAVPLLRRDNGNPYPVGTCESRDTCANGRWWQSSRNDDCGHARFLVVFQETGVSRSRDSRRRKCENLPRLSVTSHGFLLCNFYSKRSFNIFLTCLQAVTFSTGTETTIVPIPFTKSRHRRYQSPLSLVALIP